MRTTLITSALAASVLTIGFATVAGASESGEGNQVATPTTVPFSLEGLGLTPEQMDCLIGSATNVDLQDMTAIMDLMTECGINPMDLVTGALPTVPGLPTTVLAAVPTVPVGSVGPDAAAVLATLGFDPATAQCIETGLLAAVSPGDDTEALAILQSCGLSLNDLLTGLLAVNAGTGGTNAAVPTAPTTASGATPGPLVQQLIDTIQQQYDITLTPDQASCLLDNISTLDPEDVSAMLALMEQCGISLTDLSPS